MLFGRAIKKVSQSSKIRLTPPAAKRKSRPTTPAQVAELVDALASGASVRMDVEVRVLSWAPFLKITTRENRIHAGTDRCLLPHPMNRCDLYTGRHPDSSPPNTYDLPPMHGCPFGNQSVRRNPMRENANAARSRLVLWKGKPHTNTMALDQRFSVVPCCSAEKEVVSRAGFEPATH
jgi:hypothetical protein